MTRDSHLPLISFFEHLLLAGVYLTQTKSCLVILQAFRSLYVHFLDRQIYNNSRMTNYGSQVWENVFILVCTVAMFVLQAVYGKDIGKISYKFRLRVTPPGPFFGIWGVIYLGLIVAVLYAVLGGAWTTSMKVLFGITCLLNGGWAYVFVFGTKTSNVISLLVLVATATANEAVWIQSTYINTGTSWDWIICNILSFYQGWLTVASNLNIGIVLVYVLGLNQNAQAKIFWVVAPLCVVLLTLLNLTAPNGARNNACLYVSAIFGLVGALITYLQKPDEKSDQLVSEEVKQK